MGIFRQHVFVFRVSNIGVMFGWCFFVRHCFMFVTIWYHHRKSWFCKKHSSPFLALRVYESQGVLTGLCCSLVATVGAKRGWWPVVWWWSGGPTSAWLHSEDPKSGGQVPWWPVVQWSGAQWSGGLNPKFSTQKIACAIQSLVHKNLWLTRSKV